MLLFNVFWILVLTVCSLIGVHTNKIGLKHVWEMWLYQGFAGLLASPWYAFSQTMICEVSPLPQMFLFFSLFFVIGKTSAVIGPFVSEAIISASGNNMPFTFLFGLGAFSTVFLVMLDVKKSQIECEEFIVVEAQHDVFSTGSNYYLSDMFRSNSHGWLFALIRHTRALGTIVAGFTANGRL